MSSKKIIRLKTPQRVSEKKKSPEHKSPVASQYLTDQTIMKIKNHQFQNVHSALIDQLNKVYLEIQNSKQKLYRQESLRQEIMGQNRMLKTRLQMLDRELELEKEKYVLERENHERLRRFYQQREKQWIRILIEHRRLIGQYESKNDANHAKIIKKQKDQTQCGSLGTTKSSQQALTFKNNFFSSQDAISNAFEKVKENVSNNQKIQFKNITPKTAQAYYEKAMQRMEEQDTKFINKGQMSQIDEIIKQYSEGKLISHDQEKEEVFDKVVRLTFLKLKEAGTRLVQIQHSQDMIKLKKAKSSTKERLTKTLKKLNFQFQSQKEVITFCQYLQKCVIQQYKGFQGCYVFDLLMQKLYECQKLAVSSSSFIDKLLRIQDSKVSEFISDKKTEKQSQKELFQNQQSSFSMDIQKKFSLLLESAIKQKSDKKEQQFKKKILESQINQAVYSVSSLRNLSELIKQSRGDYAINAYIS